MKYFISSIIFSLLLLIGGVHLNSSFLLFSKMDFVAIFSAILAISFSILLPPNKPLANWMLSFFPLSPQSAFRSIFIGLFQFSFFQVLGWTVLTVIAPAPFNLLFKKDFFLDTNAILETSATVSTLVFAAFQTLTAAAENQYEVKGKIRFDQNDYLYTFLRIALSSSIATFFAQGDSYSVILPFAQVLLIIALMLLIPLISILFKSFSPENILLSSVQYINKNSANFFLGGFGKTESTMRDFYRLLNHLKQLTTVAAWSYKHKAHIQTKDVTAAFSKAFYDCIYFYVNLEKKFETKHLQAEDFYEDFFISLPKRELKAANHKQPATAQPQPKLSKDSIPADYPQDPIDFLSKNNPEIKMFENLFEPFKTVLLSALISNGMNYPSLAEVLRKVFNSASAIKEISWKKGIFLTVLGDLTDVVSEIQNQNNCPLEVRDLWYLLLAGQIELSLSEDAEVKSMMIYCFDQFDVRV